MTEENEGLPSGPDWNEARPATIPPPTFWPAAMAFGLTFLFWGLITSPVLWIVGLALVFTALGGWIGEMRHE
jgi:hypothetical protein